jgi:hypothetical protein
VTNGSECALDKAREEGARRKGDAREGERGEPLAVKNDNFQVSTGRGESKLNQENDEKRGMSRCQDRHFSVIERKGGAGSGSTDPMVRE